MPSEASGEHGNDQVTKSIFDTSIHPEGARAFNDGSTLADVAREHNDGTLETDIPIPEDVSNVDPLSRNVQFDKVPLLNPSREQSIHKSHKGIAAIAAGAIATAVIGGLGAIKIFGGDEREEQPGTPPVATAPATSGPSETPSTPQPSETTASPEVPVPKTDREAVGIPIDTYEMLNIHTTESEIIKRAKQPISASEYTPQEAIKLFGQRYNAFLLTGEVGNTLDSRISLTERSLRVGNDILRTIFADSVGVDSEEFAISNSHRTAVARRLDFYGNKLYTNYDTGAEDQRATAHMNWHTEDKGAEIDAKAVQFTVTMDWYANFYNIDAGGGLDIPGLDKSRSVTNVIYLIVDDQGNYRISDIRMDKVEVK